MFYAGLDLGQKRDHSAIVVVERIDRVVERIDRVVDRIDRVVERIDRLGAQLLVRYVETLPLGTPYPGVVERVREIVQCGDLAGRCVLAVDATGVGAAVVDMLRAARPGCELTAVTITGGKRGSGLLAGCRSVAKRDLMAGVLALLESGELKIGRLREARRLMTELTSVKAHMNGAGRVRLGADGYGEHDDLAIALALACWRAKGLSGSDTG